MEELLEASVVGAQDVAVDVGDFLAAKEVGHTLYICNYDANGLSSDTHETDRESSSSRS